MRGDPPFASDLAEVGGVLSPRFEQSTMGVVEGVAAAGAVGAVSSVRVRWFGPSARESLVPCGGGGSRVVLNGALKVHVGHRLIVVDWGT
jgi:hypothetical protein